MTCNSKSEGRDFVYVGADYIYLCPAGERLPYRYTNEEDGKTLRRYWTRRIDGSDPHVRRAPRTWPHRPTISVRVFTQPGSFSEVRPHSRRVRFTLTNGHRRLDRLGQKRAISGSHSILVAPTALLGLVWECEDLNPPAQTAHSSRRFRSSGRPRCRIGAG